MSDMENLICSYLQDEGSAEEVQRLSEWIRQSPENAKTFAKLALIHGHLRSKMLGEKQAYESGELPQIAHQKRGDGELTSRPRSKQHLTIRVFAGILASCLVIAAVVFFSPHAEKQIVHEDPPVRLGSKAVLAVVAQTSEAKWRGVNFEMNSPLNAGTLALESGIARLRFHDGVEVTLQGPAEYELLAIGRTRLHSGRLTATVPPGSEGFLVDTPTLEIVDLGTEFGVHLDDDGASLISVFEGEVEVAFKHDETKQLLKEGEAVSYHRNGSNKRVEFDTRPFERMWPVFSGISHSTGTFRLIPRWHRRLRFVQNDERIFVVPEGYPITLSAPLDVNISAPGEYAHREELTPSKVPTDQSVRSFILHFQPVQDGPRRRLERIQGSITFQSPVLGIIVLQEELIASAEILPRRRAGEALRHRELELTGNPGGDVITLSEDRHTIRLDLAGRSSDFVRVIVDGSINSPTETAMPIEKRDD